MLQQGLKQKDIALAIGKDKSAVLCELRSKFDYCSKYKIIKILYLL